LEKEKAIKDDGQFRLVRVRALSDCETITHTLKKGMETEIQMDHAAKLVAAGKVELISERAIAESASKEKRG
jgi:hypothetical protein